MMKRIVSLVLMSVLFVSCIKKEEYDFDNLSTAGWDPQLAIPLIKSSMEVNDILGFTDSSVVTSDESGLVTLIYSSDVQEFGTEGLVQLQDFLESISTPITTGTVPVDLPFAPAGDAEIDRVELSQGTLQINSSSSNQGTLIITFVSILKPDGNPLQLSTNLTANSNVDLTGHTITPTANNEISIQLNVTTGTPGNLDLDFSIRDMDYETIFGDFKNKVINLDRDSLRIHLFKNIGSDGNIQLDDPKIVIDIENSLGMPMSLVMDSVEGYNPVTRSVFDVIKSGVGNFKINAPEVTNVGGVIKTRIILDRNNTNVGDVFKPTPTYLVHKVGVSTNPDGTTDNHLQKGASCKMSMRIELPLSGRVTEFLIRDTVPIGLDEQIDFLEGVTIKTFMENGFPVDALVNVILLDENYERIQTSDGKDVSLLDNIKIAESATVDGDGRVLNKGVLSTESELTAEKTERLVQAKYALVIARLSTTDAGATSVKIYDDYTLDLKLGVKLKGDIGIN